MSKKDVSKVITVDEALQVWGFLCEQWLNKMLLKVAGPGMTLGMLDGKWDSETVPTEPFDPEGEYDGAPMGNKRYATVCAESVHPVLYRRYRDGRRRIIKAALSHRRKERKGAVSTRN
jgi:hypothetical protein